jgi:hypothetical protein
LLLPKPYRDGGSAVNGFDFNGMESAVRIDGKLNDPSAANQYWTAELRLPWKAMSNHDEANPAPKPGDFYRFNLSRVEWRTEIRNGKYKKILNPETGRPFPEDNWVYAPTGVVNIHYPELWAYLYFADENTPEFALPETEKMKWELRKIYYAERIHYEKHGMFTADFSALAAQSPALCEALADSPYFTPPYTFGIEAGRHLFQAGIEYGGACVSITQDGYTWAER